MAIDYESGDGIATIRLNRPPANAYTSELLSELTERIAQANADGAVRVILLKSASPKFFCAGADIKVFADNDIEANKGLVDRARRVLATLLDSPKATVAAISGHALGGGLELALACDIRLASEGRYRLGLPEISLGLMPGNGGTQLLPRLVGASAALDLLFTGEAVSPGEALRIGLVNRVYGTDRFDVEVGRFTQRLASNPGLALAATKDSVRTGATLSLPDALKLEERLVDQLYDTHDAREGFQAFLEKRQPTYLHR